MSAISTSVTNPRTPTTRRSTAGFRWALLAALVVGAAGGAGISTGLVHSQVRTVHDVQTVVVPVPPNPERPAYGPGSAACRPGHIC